MTQLEQQKAARKFANEWKGNGYEKSDSQSFWYSLLRDVYGVDQPAKYINFEKTVKDDNTKFIDGYIKKTKVLIEQKSLKIDLDKKERRNATTEFTPFEQAEYYNNHLRSSEKCNWIIICNFKEFRIYNMDDEEPGKQYQSVLLENLEKEYYRLQFLVDQKNVNIRKEEELSVKAGELVGKLYDALIKQYINPDEKSLRSLNILCVRIVFCLYAEDAGRFGTRTAFEDYIKSFNLPHLHSGLKNLFKALDTEIKHRDKYEEENLKNFPYVNGGLFRDEEIDIPNFTEEIVDVIINECAPFNWSEISPTIFGAVFESTLGTKMRRANGMHYTSVENIHKVIDPLFLDDLKSELSDIKKKNISIKDRRKEIAKFQDKISSIKILDPACGSGNFLTESYLSLAKLEIEALEATKDKGDLFVNGQSKVSINQFYGIEINDFAITVAKTALWIAESQVSDIVNEILISKKEFLPLSTNATIVEGNALRIDWKTLKPCDDSVMPKDGLFSGFANNTDGTSHEYDYIIGNPPFIGKKEQTKQQKEELISLFPGTLKGVGNLDYVTGWYVKAIDLIKNSKTKCAFVSTISITQGEQVPVLWKYLYEKKITVNFAYRTFRWDSESTEKAHVHCVIIGFSCNDGEKSKKIIFDENGIKKEVNNINGYLLDASNISIENRTNPICDVPEMVYGSMPIDDNHLILTKEEADAVIDENPANAKFVRKYKGGDELLKNKERYCLWLCDASIKEMKQSKIISQRIKETKEFRIKSTRPQTVELANTPWLFGEIRQPLKTMLVIPKVSSEQREYIPMVFVSPEIIINGSALIIPEGGLYEFGILMSKVHNSWMRVVAGRLETRYQYSGSVVYNNFPWCNSTAEQKDSIEKTAQAILDARAKYPNDSLADMYDKTFMPEDLRTAHELNDKAVMRAYGFKDDMEESEIVAELFKLYESR